jgi:hypothetical protein
MGATAGNVNSSEWNVSKWQSHCHHRTLDSLASQMMEVSEGVLTSRSSKLKYVRCRSLS